jgi:type I restriction enzyme R subunit
MSSDTSEKAFQNDIISYLQSNGYQKRKTSNYHKSTQLDVELTLKFIQETQEKEWKKFKRLYENKTEQKFLFRLVSEINKKGTIHILRNGFKESGCQFKLFYPKPYNQKNPDLFKKYNKNIFSVIDELEYEDKENGNRLDLVIFINGLPVITIELKDTFSQGVEKARDQYKLDRDAREPLIKRHRNQIFTI